MSWCTPTFLSRLHYPPAPTRYPQEHFPAFFQAVLALKAGEAGGRMRMHERVAYLVFMINVFQVCVVGCVWCLCVCGVCVMCV